MSYYGRAIANVELGCECTLIYNFSTCQLYEAKDNQMMLIIIIGVLTDDHATAC